MPKRNYDEVDTSQPPEMTNQLRCSICLGNFPTVSTVCCSKFSHIGCLSKWKNVEGRRGVSRCPLCNNLYPEPERTMRISELKYIFNEDFVSEDPDQSMLLHNILFNASFQACDESVIPYGSENSCAFTDNETKRSPYSKNNEPTSTRSSATIIHQVTPPTQINTNNYARFFNTGNVVFHAKSIPFAAPTGIVYKEHYLPRSPPSVSSALFSSQTEKVLHQSQTLPCVHPITYLEPNETNSKFGYTNNENFELEFPQPQDTKSVLALNYGDSDYDENLNADEITKNLWSENKRSVESRDETSSLSITDSENEIYQLLNQK